MIDFSGLEDVTERIASFHETHARNVLRKANINYDDFIKNPKKYTDQGYRFFHEENGEQHRMIVAKIICQEDYLVRVGVSND